MMSHLQIPTLAELLPEDAFIAPRLMEEMAGQTPFEALETESFSGALYSIAGPVPMFVHEAASRPVLASAIRDAGLEPPRNARTYSDRKDYLSIVRAELGKGAQAYYTFPVPEIYDFEGPSVVSPHLLSVLNDRGSADRLVPTGAAPHRRVSQGHVAVSEALAHLRTGQVIKRAGAPASSGGRDVRLLRAARHVRNAQQHFRDFESVIVEELVKSDRSLCVQVAVDPSGTHRWLGASEQRLTRGGAYLGSVLTQDVPGDVRMLAFEITGKAAAEGFAGVAGFDILVRRDGHPLAVDLNFRPNASTPLLMIGRHRPDVLTSGVAELIFSRFDGSLDEAFSTLRTGIDAGAVIPIAAFEPPRPGRPVAVRFVLLSSEPEAAKGRLKALTGKGFRIPVLRRGRVHRLLEKLGWAR